MRIATYNIQYTLGLDGRFDLPRIAETLESSDIIGLQEVDRHWRRTGMQDQAEALAAHFPGFHWLFAGGYDVAAYHPDPARASAAERGRRRQHGNMVLSRWPILSTRTLRLPRGLPNDWTQDRVLIEAVIAVPGRPLRVYVTHLCHIGAETRLPQVAAINQLLPTLAREGASWRGNHHKGDFWTDGDAEPPTPDDTVLLGDLNFTPDSDEYALLDGGPTGLQDAWRVLGRDPAAATFSGDGPAYQTKRIDYIWVSGGLAGHLERVWVDNDAKGSDHFPVFATLAM